MQFSVRTGTESADARDEMRHRFKRGRMFRGPMAHAWLKICPVALLSSEDGSSRSLRLRLYCSRTLSA